MTTIDRQALDQRVVVIVSPDPSDIYFANRLERSLNVVGVFVENQLAEPGDPRILPKLLRYSRSPGQLVAKTVNYVENACWQRFAVYNGSAFDPKFGELGETLDVAHDVHVVKTSGVCEINEVEYAESIRALKPDLIAVCGSSILKEPILNIPSVGTLNLHSGLSQFYRGLYTTEWALLNKEPECIGATVHFVSKGIDDGGIICQGRPKLEKDDHPNSIYAKVVILGVDMMIGAINDIFGGDGEAVQPQFLGRLYQRKDYSLRIKNQVWAQVKKGVITEYLRDPGVRDQRVLTVLVNSIKRID